MNDQVRILIVEDETIIAMELAHRLETLGYAVIGTAVTGEEAIRNAVESRPDLVLMDIHLEGEVDGVSAASQIHSRTGIPVVFATAYSDPMTLARAKVTSPYGYVLKPFEDRDLRAAIELATYRRHSEEELQRRERLLRATLKHVHDGVITVDPNGCVSLMNPAAETLSGWTLAEALTHPCSEVLKLREGSDGMPLTFASELHGVHALLLTRRGEEVPVQVTSVDMGPSVSGGGWVFFLHRMAAQENLNRTNTLSGSLPLKE